MTTGDRDIMREIHRELDLPVTSRSVLPLRRFAQACLQEAGVAEPTHRQVLAAVDDVVSGLLLRGADENRSGHITLELDINATRVRVAVRDESAGKELASESQRRVLSEHSRPRREIGLSLLQRVMDEVTYSYSRGFQNRLEMIKFV